MSGDTSLREYVDALPKCDEECGAAAHWKVDDGMAGGKTNSPPTPRPQPEEHPVERHIVPELIAIPTVVYRCGEDGVRSLTKAGAYSRAARAAVRANVDSYEPCNGGDLDLPIFSDGPLTGPCCKFHDAEYMERVIPRLARWLRWRDGKRLEARASKCGGGE